MSTDHQSQCQNTQSKNNRKVKFFVFRFEPNSTQSYEQKMYIKARKMSTAKRHNKAQNKINYARLTEIVT